MISPIGLVFGLDLSVFLLPYMTRIFFLLTFKLNQHQLRIWVDVFHFFQGYATIFLANFWGTIFFWTGWGSGNVEKVFFVGFNGVIVGDGNFRLGWSGGWTGGSVRWALVLWYTSRKSSAGGSGEVSSWSG